MLPSRGLRPAQFTPSALRQPIARSQTSRQFSSIHRASGSSAQCSRTLQSSRWRAGTSRPQNIILSASAVRHGSWYAPWSWGKSSTPGAPTTEVPIAEFTNNPISHVSDHIEPATTTASSVSTATPELAPAGIDKAAVVDNTATVKDSMSSFMQENMRTPEELQLMNPTTEIDPTRLVDHPGHLYEMGLDYGYGMTTMFEKAIETIYLTSGWGWAGSIIAAGVGVRLVTFGFQALSSNQMATMRALAPITQPIQKKMEAAIARGDKAQADLYKMQQAEVMRPHTGGIASMGGFMFIQAWIGFSAFRFLRAMSTMPVPGMSQDGFLWFTDLTLRDPNFILPAATSAIMYTVFKTGGETGVQDTNQETRMKIFTGLAVAMGAITAFQPAALQLYFLTSAILGGVTGYLLRQNGFRRLIRIRELPSKESNELFGRVAAGELKLKDIQGPDGKIRYQAPSVTSKPKTINVKPSNVRTTTTLSGINLKAGTAIPLHLKPAAAAKRETTLVDRDHDYEEGAAGKSIGEKLSYYRRNYKWSFVSRRMRDSMERTARKAGYGGAKVSPEMERRRRRAEEYELERKRRFENRS